MHIFAVLFLLAIHTNTLAANIITFGFIGDNQGSAYKGVLQGVNEANLQGYFLGFQFELVPFTQDNLNTQKELMGLFIADRQVSLLELSENATPPVFNLSQKDDVLRTMCVENLFHIIPSEGMISDSLQQWKQKNPDSNAVAQAWHPDFKKFAARDLNKRFLKAHQQKMDDESWAGWAAVKLAADSIMRDNIADADSLVRYLRDNLSFDGQKGALLDFRETGQLRQLILLVEDGKIVGEAPVRGVAKPPLLDSLGQLYCAK